MKVAATDSLAVVKRPIVGGVTGARAEAGTLGRAGLDLSSLVTTDDLPTTTVHLERSLGDTWAEILKCMFGAIAAQTVAILGAVTGVARLPAQ